MSDVLVLDYDPNWPRLFETLRSSIWDAISDIAMSIEHVGSTAVPGLAAKPEAKTAFLVAILREVGFAEDDLAEIVQSNRRPKTGQ